MAIINGTESGESLDDTSEDDTINGLGGDDTITLSLGGADVVDGGEGSDRLILDSRTLGGAITMGAPTQNADGLSGTALLGALSSATFERIEHFTIFSRADQIDRVQTGGGDDVFHAFGGAVAADTGADSVHMGAGADHLVVDYGAMTTAVSMGQPGNSDGTGSTLVVEGLAKLPFTGVNRLTITTGAGDDTLFGTDIGDDKISTGDGNDIIDGGAFDDSLLGKGGDDSLFGAGGDDWLRGGGGADSMAGGEGDDTYYVDNAGDVVIELPGEGADTVRTRIDFDAGGLEIERIIALDPSGLALTGGDNATRIRGGAGADTLTGGAAGDVLRGGGGDDRIVASAGGDYAIGGAGADSFVLDSVTTGVDRIGIADLASGTDILEIDADDFGGGLTPGALDPDAFVANASGAAEDAEDRLLYNNRNGTLLFDADGTGGEAAIVIAKLLRAPTIDAGDFLVTGSVEAPFAGERAGALDAWRSELVEAAAFVSQLP